MRRDAPQLLSCNPASSVEMEKISHSRSRRVQSRRIRNSHRRKSMMMDWNQYHKEVGARIGDLMKVSPDTVRGYQTLSAANSKTSKLGEKTRQLISLAVAVTTHCDGCIVVHTDAALKAGATKGDCRSSRSCRRHERGRRARLFLARARCRGSKISCGPRRLVCDTPWPGLLQVNLVSHSSFSRNTLGQGG